MVIDCTPLISIDLVVRDSSGRVLLGQRLNRPAKVFYRKALRASSLHGVFGFGYVFDFVRWKS